MVVGTTSSFVEGFKSFTADDDLMLANIKQALNYSSENLSIPDAKLNLPTKTTTPSTIRPQVTTTTRPHTTTSNTTTTKPSTTTIPNTTRALGNDTFSNVANNQRNSSNNIGDSEDEEDEDTEGDEEYENEMKKQVNKGNNNSRDLEEGFQGSLEIESRNLKNVLLALLLSFIGYLVVYASNNNYIPLAEISPQLKKFKHLVYGGLFFVIAYICLEVF